MSFEPAATRFPDLDSLSADLSRRIAAALEVAIADRGSASLVVSGGRSPIALFETLRTSPIDWSRVRLTLADERWVDPSDASSNERMVREVLLRDAAAAARFTPLKNGADTPQRGATAAWSALADIPRPFDVVLLGMGDDGHTASLFPDSPGLSQALDADAPPACVAMRAPSAPAARISLNLAALLDSRRIVILITGESKWRAYSMACAAGPAGQMPVRAVLRQHRSPVEVNWSP